MELTDKQIAKNLYELDGLRVQRRELDKKIQNIREILMDHMLVVNEGTLKVDGITINLHERITFAPEKVALISEMVSPEQYASLFETKTLVNETVARGLLQYASTPVREILNDAIVKRTSYIRHTNDRLIGTVNGTRR